MKKLVFDFKPEVEIVDGNKCTTNNGFFGLSGGRGNFKYIIIDDKKLKLLEFLGRSIKTLGGGYDSLESIQSENPNCILYEFETKKELMEWFIDG